MATISANADGTHKIRKAMKSLKKQKERIEELEDLLKLAKEEYIQLERELAVSQVQANPRHISRLPTEILAMFFNFFLCNNETHIRRLMLVCKQWYHFVINTPDMWTNIRIEIPEGCWDVRSWLNSIRPFVLICLERSHRNLLDISFRLSELGYGSDISLWRLCSAVADTYDFEALVACLDDGGWTLMDYETEPNDFDEEILSLLEDLTGPNGELMMRWGSFELHFPRDVGLALTIWEGVVHPTPNLTTLRLFGLQHLDNRNTPPHAFTDLSKLQNLCIDDVDHWEFISLSPSSLRHIQVQTNIENTPALQLSRFQNLTSLKILREDVKWNELPSGAGPTHITLPRLQDLTLVAPFEHLTRSDFSLPSLKRLFLVCSHKESPKQLPRLQPIFVQWYPSQKLDYGSNSVHSVCLESILRDLLCHFTAAAEFSVPASQKPALLGLLTRMSTEGTLPYNWEMVSFYSEEGIVDRVVVQEFLKDQ